MRVGRAVFEARIPADPEKFGLPSKQLPLIVQACERSERQLRALGTEVAKIETVMVMRIQCCLALLAVDRVGERIHRVKRMRRRGEELLDVLDRLHVIAEAVARLRAGQPSMRAGREMLKHWSDDEHVHRVATTALKHQQENLAEVRSVLASESRSSDGAAESVMWDECVFLEVPPPGDFSATLTAADRVLEQVDTVYSRVSGELAQIVEGVEAAVGLPPLGTGSARPEGSS
jgi:hypothetical protein